MSSPYCCVVVVAFGLKWVDYVIKRDEVYMYGLYSDDDDETSLINVRREALIN